MIIIVVKPFNRVKFFIQKFSRKLVLGLSSCGGRNFRGRICIAHRGGGNKKKYRAVDRFRRLNQGGSIIKLFKFPALSGFLGVVVYDNGLSSFILLSSEVKAGYRIFSGDILSPKESFLIGSSLILKNINLFSLIHSIEKVPFEGASFVRSAGSSAFISSREKNNKVWVKLNSGWQIMLSQECIASLGNVSNSNHIFYRVRKAGIVRLMGFRPKVRGIAMNPCDHPHGGGEGRGSPPRAQVSPWGRLTKGTPTNNTKQDRLKRRLFKKI